MRLLIAILVGFLTSGLLNCPLHQAGVPELARYTVGGALIVACYAALHPDDEAGMRRVFLAAACAGFGVGIARLWGVITHGGE